MHAKRNRVLLDKKWLEKRFPFRAPFLLIDNLLYYAPGNKVITEKYVTGKEWFLKGHFPNNPIMPGHLIAESMVQTCSLVFGKFGDKAKRRLFYLASSKTRFFNVVRPRDKMIIVAYPVKVFSTAGIVKAEVYVKDRLVAKGEFTVALQGHK